jgi:hypothetical protein
MNQQMHACIFSQSYILYAAGVVFLQEVWPVNRYASAFD